MIIYSVTVTVEKTIEKDWLYWMLSSHIPDVMATGYFTTNNLRQLLDPAPPKDSATFNIQYECESIEKLQMYQKTAASALQKDHIDRYGDQAVAFRTVLKTIK